MSHFGHEVPQTMVTLLTKAVGAFLLLVVFFIFSYIFESEFTCSCSPEGIQTLDILYMVIPPCIIYLLLYAMNKHYQRLFCGWFKRFNKHCSCFVQHIVQFLSIGLFWVAAVFMDGDWYVCLMGNQDEIQMKIPCMKKDNLTFEQNMFIVRYKSESKTIGLCLTLVGAILLVMWSRCGQGKCCEPYYKMLYEDHKSQNIEMDYEAALTELAREQSKLISQKHIETIRRNERRPLNQRSDIEDTWETISALFTNQKKESESLSDLREDLDDITVGEADGAVQHRQSQTGGTDRL